MTPDEIKRLRELSEKATTEPWALAAFLSGDKWVADANALPSLLDALEAKNQEIARLEEGARQDARSIAEWRSDYGMAKAGEEEERARADKAEALLAEVHEALGGDAITVLGCVHNRLQDLADEEARADRLAKALEPFGNVARLIEAATTDNPIPDTEMLWSSAAYGACIWMSYLREAAKALAQEPKP